MRDIYKYGKEYKELPFEKYQVKYRRKKVLELLKKYKHKSVLEIGCGEEPLFMHEDSVVNWVVVEPNKEFFQKAEMLSGSNAKCINNTLENAVDEIKQMNIEFEYIICSSLLHEVEDKSQLLNAIKKLCSTDTIIHINVPNAK